MAISRFGDAGVLAGTRVSVSVDHYIHDINDCSSHWYHAPAEECSW